VHRRLAQAQQQLLHSSLFIQGQLAVLILAW
jgi:hypothetical protein